MLTLADYEICLSENEHRLNKLKNELHSHEQRLKLMDLGIYIDDYNERRELIETIDDIKMRIVHTTNDITRCRSNIALLNTINEH